MKTPSFRSLAPYLAAIVVFILITFAYFSPLLEGKQILQSDIVNHKGMSKEIVDYRNATGQEPLWTNSMFGGMPAYQISVKYTSNLIGYLDKIFTLGLPHPANLVFLYFLGFFFLLLVLKIDPWLSIAGAIGFAFSSFFFIIIGAGHNSQAHAIGYIAPVLAGIILAYRKNYLWGGIITAVFFSLELYAGHPQITYYMLLLAGIIGLAELVSAVRDKWIPAFLKATVILMIAGFFGVANNATNLWATWEYGKYTIRGKSELTTELHNRTSGLDKDYATQWSYGKAETMTLLIPNFFGGGEVKLGGNSNVAKALRENNVPEENIKQFTDNPFPTYWGAQPFTSGPVYIGAIICFLFVLGLIIVKGPVKWGLLAATILSIMLAWGHNFMALTDFFLTYFPGYNKFRAVSMTLVIAEVAMPLLGIMAIKELFDAKTDPKAMLKKVIIAASVTAGLAMIFFLVPDMFFDFTGRGDTRLSKDMQFPDWLMQALREDRKSILRMDSLRSAAFILLAAGLLFAGLKKMIKAQYVYLIMALLILIDMYPVAKRYMNNDSFTSKSKAENPIQPTPADEQILKDTSPDYRVFNVAGGDPFSDSRTSYFHKSIGGYHGAKLRRYQEVIDYQLSKNNMAVLDMLNTKYFIVPDENRNPQVQMNPGALGNAWFVSAYQLVNTPDDELNALTKFNPKDTAIVDKRFADALKTFVPGRDSAATIRLTSYQPNKLNYEYRSSKNELCVFSEIYYPKGWNAYLDGKPADHFRVNFILRAMVLPAGDHKVEFRFEPEVYAVGEKISLASSVLLILLVIGVAVVEGRTAFRKEA